MRLNLDDARLAVHSITTAELQAVSFDLGLYALGYEARSRFIVESLADKTRSRCGIDLGGEGIASYAENSIRASNRQDNLVPVAEVDLRKPSEWLNPIGERNGTNIFVDVSSMDRRTMSQVFYHLLKRVGSRTTNIYVLYAPAKFTPPLQYQLPVETSAPVNGLLTGRPRDPRFPTVLFLGLGYEFGLALGVVEMFEPGRVFAFVPQGQDQRFDQHVEHLNAGLFANEKFVSRVSYGLQSPASAFIDFKERLLAWRDKAKIVVVPLGPKIFASIGILLGYIYSPELAVWRISTQIDTEQAEREADGSVLGYRLQIRAPATG